MLLLIVSLVIVSNIIEMNVKLLDFFVVVFFVIANKFKFKCISFFKKHYIRMRCFK